MPQMPRGLAKCIGVLELFNEKAEKLDRLPFMKALRAGNTGYTVTAGPDGRAVVERRGPTDDQVDAFILTYRFFIQDNEPTSFHNIERLYSCIPVETPWRTGVTTTRRNVNLFLDCKSPFKLKGYHYTNRELHNVFIWGGLAHANRRKKRIFDEWRRETDLFPMLLAEFIWVVGTIYGAISWFRHANTEVLVLLRSSSRHNA